MCEQGVGMCEQGVSTCEQGVAGIQFCSIYNIYSIVQKTVQTIGIEIVN